MLEPCESGGVQTISTVVPAEVTVTEGIAILPGKSMALTVTGDE